MAYEEKSSSTHPAPSQEPVAVVKAEYAELIEKLRRLARNPHAHRFWTITEIADAAVVALVNAQAGKVEQ